MKTSQATASTIYHVENDRTLSLAGVAGDQLRVIRGRIWLTEESLGSDRILEAGDVVALVEGEVAVLQALGASVVTVVRRVTRDVATPVAAASAALARLARAGGALRVRLHLGPHAALTIAP